MDFFDEMPIIPIWWWPVGVLVIASLCVLFFKWIPQWERESEAEEKEQENELAKLGFEVNDVNAFLKVTDFDMDEFLGSNAIQNQFKVFLNGGTTSFIESAKSQKEISEAKSSDSGNLGAGMALGIAIGSTINRNH